MRNSKKHVIEPRVARPKKIGEAKAMIAEAFRYTKWGKDDQARYFKIIGVKGADSSEDVRRIIADLAKDGQILFDEEI